MSLLESDRSHRLVGLLTIIGLGSIFLAIHFSHMIGPREDLQTFVLGIFLPMLTAAALVGGGFWLSLRTFEPNETVRVAGWVVFMASFLFIGQLLTNLYQLAEGAQLSHTFYVLVNAASGGGAVGFIVGLYDARRQRARRKSERLSSQLSVLNRVLRHDIRNGATVIQGRADLIEGQLDDADHATLIQEQAGDLVTLGEHARTIEDMQELGRDVSEVVDIREWMENHVEQVQEEYPDARISTDFDGKAEISAHPLIDTALANVIKNAIEHSDKQVPNVTIAIESVDADGEETVVVRVADNGPGIPQEEVAVLERGYETPLDHMSGLGLWLVNWIVRASGGEVKFQENEPEGSIVSIRLEAAGASEPALPELLRN